MWINVGFGEGLNLLKQYLNSPLSFQIGRNSLVGGVGWGGMKRGYESIFISNPTKVK